MGTTIDADITDPLKGFDGYALKGANTSGGLPEVTDVSGDDLVDTGKTTPGGVPILTSNVAVDVAELTQVTRRLVGIDSLAQNVVYIDSASGDGRKFKVVAVNTDYRTPELLVHFEDENGNFTIEGKWSSMFVYELGS